LGLPNPCTIGELAAANIPGISSGGVILSGTAGNPKIIAFIDFISPPSGAGSPIRGCGANIISTNGVSGALNYVTWVGCRFQSNALVAGSTSNLDVFSPGSGNQTFSYCSITPLASLWTSPPLNGGGAWPASSVGTGLDTGSGASYLNYVIPYVDGNTFLIAPGNLNTFDHCDGWGSENQCGFSASSTSLLVQDCWFHDPRAISPSAWNSGTTYTAYRSAAVIAADPVIYAAITTNVNSSPAGGGNPNWQVCQTGGQSDHTDIVGFTTGSGVTPTGQTIRHCTLAGLGNAANVSMQASVGSGAYNNWIIENNYISGCNTCLYAGHSAPVTPPVNNTRVINNTFATDLKFANLVLQGANADWTGGANGNLWKNNRLLIYPGDNWSTLISPANGQYIWPDGTNNNTEFV
jgi:hypothetical protein